MDTLKPVTKRSKSPTMLSEQSYDSDEYVPREKSIERKKGMGWKNISIIVVLVVCASIAGYSWYELNSIKKLNDPVYRKKIADEQTVSITAQVAKLIELPQETPQIATVSDVEVLKQSQPFFAKAINGDYVLIFTDEAILYRASTNKIINVAPVNRDAATQPHSNQASGTPAPTSTVATSTSTTTISKTVPPKKK